MILPTSRKKTRSNNDHIDLDTYSVGLFGQYFAGESLTLGLSGGVSWNDATDESGPGSFDAGETDVWFVSAAAKFYATPQFALAINGGFSRADLWTLVLSPNDFTAWRC